MSQSLRSAALGLLVGALVLGAVLLLVLDGGAGASGGRATRTTRSSSTTPSAWSSAGA